tara:strand:- start:162 stop:440 length:279 start_codon:yes stop_codon:yes gene_type:complete
MSSKSINIGPFAKSIAALEEFASNVYVSHLYGETIDELLLAEKELDEAIELNTDKSEIKSLKSRVSFLQAVVSMANENYSMMSDAGYKNLDH